MVKVPSILNTLTLSKRQGHLSPFQRRGNLSNITQLVRGSPGIKQKPTQPQSSIPSLSIPLPPRRCGDL